MSGIEHLVEQHIREYESRQRHVDELIERAHKGVGKAGEELADIRQTHDKLSGELEELKARPITDWKADEIKESGPMGILYALAQKLESLVEKLEK